MIRKGYFVVSLDFELYWGVRDKRKITDYADSLKKVHDIVPELLLIFKEFNVKATFATVGFLFAKNKDEIIKFCPQQKPVYKDTNLSPYTDNFTLVKDTPEQDPFHYAIDLIDLIRNSYPKHEIGSHTFSHYYCQEEGQTIDDFDADLAAAVGIAKDKGIKIESLVFPRNQYNSEYLKICKKHGISSFRGNESKWYYAPESEAETTLKKRIFRTLDCYVNLSGHNTVDPKGFVSQDPVNIQSSKFLRPYNPKGGKLLEGLKLARIKQSMTHAAKTGEVYHLWWHPHNFGSNTAKNFESLKEILDHFKNLNLKFGFESRTMSEIAKEW